MVGRCRSVLPVLLLAGWLVIAPAEGHAKINQPTNHHYSLFVFHHCQCRRRRRLDCLENKQVATTTRTNMPPKKVKRVMTLPINVIFSHLQVGIILGCHGHRQTLRHSRLFDHRDPVDCGRGPLAVHVVSGHFLFGESRDA